MEDQDSILNELLERINNLESKNESMRKTNIDLKQQIKNTESKKSTNSNTETDPEKNKNNTEDENKEIEIFKMKLKNLLYNSNDFKNNIVEYDIEYITQEQYNKVYIMGDFTNWELKPMKKYKDIFRYHVVLIKGFKYYYSLQSGDQIFIDYDNLYEQNPKNLQTQNYIELDLPNKSAIQFDYQKDMNILKSANQNLFLLNIANRDMDENLFLYKFKNNCMKIKEKITKNNSQRSKLINSLYTFYDHENNIILNYFNDTHNKNIFLYFKDRILVNYITRPNNIKYKYLYKITSISNMNFSFKAIKLYDNNNIKIDIERYKQASNFFHINFDQVSAEPLNESSKLYHLLSKEESNNIISSFNNDKQNIIKAHFKKLTKIRNRINPNNININNFNIGTNSIIFSGMRTFTRTYGAISVTPTKIEPENIKIDQYEFTLVGDKINLVRNKETGDFVQYEIIEDADKPIQYQIYYSIVNNDVKILHIHAIDNSLKDKKIVIKIINDQKEAKILKKDENYIKNDELLFLILNKTLPFKLYYKGKKVQMELINIIENKLYMIKSSNSDSYFNNMYVTVNQISEKLNNELIEQCDKNINDNFINGIDVTLLYDIDKNLVPEPMGLALSPCFLEKLSIDQEDLFINKQNNELPPLNNYKEEIKKDIGKCAEMEKYETISKKVSELKKYNKDHVSKMSKEEIEKIRNLLEEYKNSLTIIDIYVQENEKWDLIDEISFLSTDIDDLLKLFSQ